MTDASESDQNQDQNQDQNIGIFAGAATADVTLTGTKFTGNNAVFETSPDGTTWTVKAPTGTPTATSAVLTLPTPSPGQIHVRVTNDGGSSPPLIFTINARPAAPTLTNLNPTSAYAQN